MKGPSIFEALGGRKAGVTPKSASKYTRKSRAGREIVGETLNLKRLTGKKGGPGGTIGTRSRGTHPITKGSMVAKRVGKKRAKLARYGGTLGGKPRREKKKQPQAIGKTKS